MPRRNRCDRLTLAVSVAFATVLMAASCSSDSDGIEIPDGVDAIVAEEVVALTATPAGTWGNGRALRALPVDDATTAVVTTTGVYLADADGGLANLDLFGEPTEIGAAALTGDRSILAVASLWPSVVRWYHIGERRPIGVDDVGPGGDFTAFGFLGGTDVLAAVTSTGLTTWPLGSAGGTAAPLEGAVPVGASAFVGDRLVIPLAGGDEIAVVGQTAVDRVPLDLPDGATLLGARSSPDEATVAIAYFDPATGDHVAVLDAATLDRIGTVDADTAVGADAWAVTDRSVAVANGPSLSMWTHSGDALGTQPTPSDQTIDVLLAGHDRVVAVHHAGATAVSVADGTTPSLLLDAGGVSVEHAVVDRELDELVAVDFYGRISRRGLASDAEAAVDDRFAAGTATGVSVSADDATVAVGATTGRVALLGADLRDAGGFAVRPEATTIDDVAFDPATSRLSTGLAERLGALAFDDTVTTWDVEAGVGVHSFGGESEDVADCGFFHSRVVYTDDGSSMAVTSHDFTVAVLEPETGELVHRFETQAGTTLGLAFAGDGDLLVATSERSTVTVWNLADRTVAATYGAPLGGFRAIDVMPDGATMATVDGNGTVQLVEVLTGRSMLVFEGTASPTTSIALSNDGAMLAAPDDDATVTIWSTDSGLPLATLTGHTDTVTDVSFAADGTWLVTSSDDGTVRRWNLDAST